MAEWRETMIPKFKAWDSYYEKMVEVLGIDFEYKVAYVKPKDGDSYEVHFDNLQFLQSTMLKDKNKKTYSHNDLVKWNGKIYRLILGTYQFVLMGFNESYQDDPSDFFSEGAYLDAEIVGNIYENPELLEVE